MREAIVYEDWDLEARPNSRLKLLYSVPFSVLENIEEADEDNQDDEENGPVSVSFGVRTCPDEHKGEKGSESLLSLCQSFTGAR